jgi:3-methyladenine DNA glycosylase AlkD
LGRTYEFKKRQKGMDVVKTIIQDLKTGSKSDYIKKLEHFGIETKYALGTPMPYIRHLAKAYKKRHDLALQLWETKIHEARLLATVIDDPKEVTRKQAEAWVKDLSSWDICDQLCMNLLDRTAFAVDLINEFVKRENEFEKRAGFAMIAAYTIHNKKAKDEVFIGFLDLIIEHAYDGRNFVKKAVNWALRSIGKRNENLRQIAMAVSKELLTTEDKTAGWIARDALKELEAKGILKLKSS